MMCQKEIIISILLLLIIDGVFSKKAPFEGTNILKINKTVEMAMLSVQEDMNYILYYHTTTRPCAVCDKYNKALLKFAKKWDGVIKIYEMDCGALESNDGGARGSVLKCDRKEDHKLPQIDFYQPPTSRWDNAKNNMALAEPKTYEGSPEIEFMEQFMFPLLTNYGKVFVTDTQLQEYLNEDYVGSKALVFISERGVTPEMKALTSFFLDRLDFAFIHPELDEVIEKYGVEKTPALHIIVKDTDTGIWGSPVVYEGPWRYSKLRKFCSKFALQQKRVKPEHSFFDKERSEIEEEKRMDPEERAKKQKERADRKKWLYEFDGNNFEEEMQKREEDVVLVHSYTQKSGKHKEWESVSRKLKGLVTFYEINPSIEINKELIDTEFVGLESPFIALYPPGEINKRRKGRRIFSKDASFGKMATFVHNYIPDPTRSLNEESMRVLITHSLNDHMGACILFHKNPSTLLSFRKIAGNKEYKKYLNFGSFKNPSADIMESIAVKRYPSVVIFFSDFNKDHEVDLKRYPIQLAFFHQSILVSELEKFIGGFIDTNIKPKQGATDANIENLVNPNQWESCQHNVICLIGFTDSDGEHKVLEEKKKLFGWSDEESRERSTNSILRRIKGKYDTKSNNINVWYVDGACHHDMLLEFGINKDQLPKLIAIWHHKRKFTLLKSEFTYENIDFFMKKALRGAVTQSDYPLNFQFHNRNCAQYKQQVLEWQTRDAKKALNETVLENEDDIRKEVLEETKKREGKSKGKQKNKVYWSE